MATKKSSETTPEASLGEPETTPETTLGEPETPPETTPETSLGEALGNALETILEAPEGTDQGQLMETVLQTTEAVSQRKSYEFDKPEFGSMVCQQCGEKRRTNENGPFCPANDPECPRYVAPNA